MNIFQVFWDFIVNSGFARLFDIRITENGIENGEIIMIAVSCVLIYLAIGKGFEPLLLLPISFGMLLANLPLSGLMNPEFFSDPKGNLDIAEILSHGGLFDILYLGVKCGVYPPLIFLGVGAMTDFGPLIANPKSILLGAAAQLGIFFTFISSLLLGFNALEASAIGIIGGADGPTAILVTKTLAPHLLAAIAVAAYSYMALVPIIQPPIMKALTTKKERSVVMEQLRPVSKKEKILFPIVTAAVIILILPDSAPLIGMLMLGNLFRECGVTERLSKTAQNEMCNLVTICLGLTVGATASANNFLRIETLSIILLGLIAFCIATAGGVLFGKLMYLFTGGKVNPLIGAAGVSAVPMAARVANTVGQKEVPGNFLLMHAIRG